MESSENRILKQKLIIRDKTIERLKDELIEVNKLNLLLEKEMNDTQKTIKLLQKKNPKKKTKKEIDKEKDGKFKKLEEIDGSFKEPEEDIGVFVQSKSEILLNPDKYYDPGYINNIIKKYNGNIDATYIYHSRPNILDNDQCLKLINYINDLDDDNITTDKKLNVKDTELQKLIGKDTYEKLIKLYNGEHNSIYIRKVIGDNSLIDLHKDYSTRTMKVALNNPSEYKGGDLLYFKNGMINKPDQLKGSITIHNNDIIHGVTPITLGERYSLFILYTPKKNV